MSCAHTECKKAEKIQLPTVVYDVAANLVTTLCDLVNAGIKTLPDTLTTSEIIAVLLSLVRRNEELTRELAEHKTPAVQLTRSGMRLTFGPNNAYVLSVPVRPADYNELADQLDEISSRLRDAAKENTPAFAQQQILFPFVECA